MVFRGIYFEPDSITALDWFGPYDLYDINSNQNTASVLVTTFSYDDGTSPSDDDT